MFPQITFNKIKNGRTQRMTNGWREARIHQHQTRCVDMTSADLDELEKSKNEANTVKQKAGLEAREIMAVSVHR